MQAGADADFDIHCDAGASIPGMPVTVYYSTMVQSGSSPTAFTPTEGQAVFSASDFSVNSARRLRGGCDGPGADQRHG